MTDPTCTEQGYTTYTCACGDSYLDDYTEAYGHTESDWITDLEADCETDGEKHKECIVCGTVLETATIPAELHTYESAVTDPTCTEQGYTTHTCTTCGDAYEDSFVAELGHSYESAVTDPTCTEQGYTTHTCTMCGDAYEDSFVAVSGHSYGEWTITVDPTCTAKGKQQRECVGCDRIEAKSVAPLGHRYEAVVTAPTCTEKGYTTYTCVCGDHYLDEYVEAYEHTPSDWIVDQEPSIGADGSQHKECIRCGRILATEVMDALPEETTIEQVTTQPDAKPEDEESKGESTAPDSETNADPGNKGGCNGRINTSAFVFVLLCCVVVAWWPKSKIQ